MFKKLVMILLAIILATAIASGCDVAPSPDEEGSATPTPSASIDPSATVDPSATLDPSATPAPGTHVHTVSDDGFSDSNDDTHTYKCTECGETVTENHDFYFVQDGSIHFSKCDCGYETNYLPHTPDENEICVDCGMNCHVCTVTGNIVSSDDEYHYYVKAVPKIAVSAPDVKVQRIYTRKTAKTDKKQEH